MKLTLKIPTLSILVFVLTSCDRVERKAEQITEKAKDKTKETVERQTDKVVHKIFPPFDHDKPDTENNKKRFKDFLKIEITPDVKNIYCFDDPIGIDTDYMFSFDCDSSTSKKIIEVNNLKVDSINEDNGFNMQHDFNWWNKKRIAKLKKYSWTNGDRYFKYYWYDKENGKAYFFDFDM
jgi:hypothetical protein